MRWGAIIEDTWGQSWDSVHECIHIHTHTSAHAHVNTHVSHISMLLKVLFNVMASGKKATN